MATHKTDGSINEELFVLVLLEDKDSKSLRRVPDLERASQSDICSLMEVFETWVRGAVGEAATAGLDNRDNPRFCDLLVVDEGSLRSLAALPEKIPSLGPVTRQERRVSRLPSYFPEFSFFIIWPQLDTGTNILRSIG